MRMSDPIFLFLLEKKPVLTVMCQ